MKRQFIVLLLAGGILLPSLPVSADGLFSNITNSQNAADEYKQFRNEVEQYRKKYNSYRTDLVFKLQNNSTDQSSISDYEILIDKISQTVSDYISSDTAASMTYWENLFGGPEKAPKDNTYHDIIEVLGSAYDDDLEEVKLITQNFKKNLRLVFKDEKITDLEYQNITSYLQDYDSLLEKENDSISKNEEKSPSDTVESTDTCCLVDFCELFAQRYVAYQKDNNNSYEIPANNFVLPASDGDMIQIQTTPATLTIDKDDFSICQATIELDNSLLSDEESNKMSIRCIMALSALEYPFDVQNAENKSIGVWKNQILPAIKKLNFNSLNSKSERILIYSGNYDYYLSSLETSIAKYYYINAEKR